MDTRYQIEEMVSQDERGVVFQGTDSVTGVIVAIRRFISSGGKEGGIPADAGKSFDEAVQRLKELNHPMLRRILAGGCDAVDNMPYLVARWCEGRPLADFLADSSGPDPEFVRDLLVGFMDANDAVEEVIGKRGLWLEPTVAATFVRPARGDLDQTAALFWLCPWSLFHSGSGEAILTAVADLAEDLLGGPRKTGAFPAFAQWIAAIRRQGISTKEEAKAALVRLQLTSGPAPLAVDSSTSDQAEERTSVTKAMAESVRREDPAGFDAPGLNAVPAPVVMPASVVVLPGAAADKRGIGRKTGVAAAVLLAGAGLAVVLAAKRATEATPATEVDFAAAEAAPGSSWNASAAAPWRAMSGAEAERREFVERRGYFTIDDGDLLHAHDQQMVTLRGRLANIRNSSSGLTMYLEFSEEPPNDQPRAFSMVRNQVDGIRSQDLEPLKGRLVEIRGRVDVETLGSIRRPRVELRDAGGIRVLDDAEDYELR